MEGRHTVKENHNACQDVQKPACQYEWCFQNEIAPGVAVTDLGRSLRRSLEKAVLQYDDSGERTRVSDSFENKVQGGTEDEESTSRKRKLTIIAKVYVDSEARKEVVVSSKSARKLDNMTNREGELQEEVNGLKCDVSRFERFVKRLANSVEEQQSEIESLRNEVQCFKDKREEYRTKEDRLETDVGTIKNKIQMIRDDLYETNDEKATIREKLNQLELQWHMGVLRTENAD